MKTSIIIILCLAVLQSSTAQNAEPATETLLTPSPPSTQPLPPAGPAPIESATAPTTPTPELTTETSTITLPPTPELITEASKTTISTPAPPNDNKTGIQIAEKLSERIKSILVHLRSPEPTGFPGQTVLLDPMPAPNASTSVGLGSSEYYDMQVYGLSKFTVEGVNMLWDEMQVYVMIRFKKLLVIGNFTATVALGITSRGPFNMTLTNVTAEGTVRLKVDSNGKLYADKSTSDMQYGSLEVGSNATAFFRPVLNTAGLVVLSEIKPTILVEVEKRLVQEVNKQLETVPNVPKLVNRSPVDLAIIEARKYLREFCEPFVIKTALNHESKYLVVNIGPIAISGLSKFARVGNITTQMTDKVIRLGARFITGRLNGTCRFDYDFGKVDVIRNSTTKFYIDHFQFEAKINQSVDLRKSPILDDLQLEMGKILIKMDDTGDFDFLVELLVQQMPNMIRQLITDVLEDTVKETIQTEVFDKMNVDEKVEKMNVHELVENNLPAIQNFFNSTFNNRYSAKVI